MDAVEFWKTFQRMCDNTDCRNCPLDQKCRPSALVAAEEVIEAVERWVADHPTKTRQSEFLKMFPDALMNGNVLWMCPKYVEDSYRPKENCDNVTCTDCKRAYWLTEASDND